MNDFWRTLPRDEDGRWTEDGIPNMATTRKPKPETDDEKATDQREVQTESPSDSAVSAPPSPAGKDEDGPAFEREDAHTDESEVGGYTGIDGEAFPDKPEVIQSDVTETVTSVAGTEYEQPKYRAVRDDRSVHLSPYGWVGPEAIVVQLADLDDFKAFVASL